MITARRWNALKRRSIESPLVRKRLLYEIEAQSAVALDAFSIVGLRPNGYNNPPRATAVHPYDAPLVLGTCTTSVPVNGKFMAQLFRTDLPSIVKHTGVSIGDPCGPSLTSYSLVSSAGHCFICVDSFLSYALVVLNSHAHAVVATVVTTAAASSSGTASVTYPGATATVTIPFFNPNGSDRSSGTRILLKPCVGIGYVAT